MVLGIRVLPLFDLNFVNSTVPIAICLSNNKCTAFIIRYYSVNVTANDQKIPCERLAKLISTICSDMHCREASQGWSCSFILVYLDVHQPASSRWMNSVLALEGPSRTDAEKHSSELILGVDGYL